MSVKADYDFFPPEAVDEWVRTRLSDYYKYDDIASLTVKGETAPEVLVKFAELAKALKLPVMASDYGNALYVKRPKSAEEQRKLAVEAMRAAHEHGEIDDSGHGEIDDSGHPFS
jgi:hypothetical protein